MLKKNVIIMILMSLLLMVVFFNRIELGERIRCHLMKSS